MLIIVLAWIYVLGMMVFALFVEPGGSMFAAIVKFLVYGFGPPAVLLYLWGVRRRRQLRSSDLSFEPDRSSQPAADPVATKREEP